MIVALLISAALAGDAPSTVSTARDALIQEATDHLLNGEPLPADIDARLMALSPQTE